MSQTAFVQRYAKWCKQLRYQARVGRAEKIYEHSKDLIAHAAQGRHDQVNGEAGRRCPQHHFHHLGAAQSREAEAGSLVP